MITQHVIHEGVASLEPVDNLHCPKPVLWRATKLEAEFTLRVHVQVAGQVPAQPFCAAALPWKRESANQRLHGYSHQQEIQPALDRFNQRYG